MANVQLFDLARMTVSSTGTGTISLNAAVSAFLTFDAAGCSTAATGQAITYAINDVAQTEMAPGVYYSSSVQLTRGSSLSGLHSTNNNSPIDMTNAAQVCIAPSAADFGLTGQIPGTQTNDDAATGKVGEYATIVVTRAAPVSVPNNAYTDITSINIPSAGDWSIYGGISASAAVAFGGVDAAISSVSASSSIESLTEGRAQLANATATAWSASLGPRRVSVANSTTYYLTIIIGGSTGNGYGSLSIRRVR